MLSRDLKKRLAKNTRPGQQPQKNILKNKQVIKRMSVISKHDCIITLKNQKPIFKTKLL